MSLAAHETKPLGQFAARALTDRIKRGAEELWGLLLDAYERKAWAALGYTSWREYAQTEFGMGQSHAYRLLDQARVVLTLGEAAGSPIGELSEYEARDIKPVLEEVAGAVRARITADIPKERAVEIVREEVEKARRRSASARGAKELMDELNPPGFDPVADQERTLKVAAFYDVLQELLTFSSPAELIPEFRPYQFEYVQMVPRAIAWLTEFEQEWRKAHG